MSDPKDPNIIPIVNIVGPGSQPTDEDGVLEYMTMPTNMSTFETPILPEPDEVGDISGAIAFLEDIKEALEDYPKSQQAQIFSLDKLNANEVSLINQILAVGEVSATIAGPSEIEIQESVMAGLWRVHHLNTAGNLDKDYLEIANIPTAIKQLSFQAASNEVDIDVEGIPDLINSPSLLVEINDRVKSYSSSDPTHVINLSLLPLSPADLNLLGQRMGVGPVTILSRGYGNCRIGSTAKNNVWWIKYYNSDDSLILNTIEVVEVPEVAVAAHEDIEDSAHRLEEIIEVYKS